MNGSKRIPFDQEMIDHQYYGCHSTGDEEIAPYESYTKVIKGVEVKFFMLDEHLLQMRYNFVLPSKLHGKEYKGISIHSFDVMEVKQNAEFNASIHIDFVKGK